MPKNMSINSRVRTTRK